MTTSNRFGTVITVFLIAVIVIGGIVAWSRYSPSPAIAISLTPEPDSTGEVCQEESPQKIDINRAEAWLLEALPGIGETLAQRIVDYRQKNGDFRNITEITEVEGIGPDIYDQIKDLITVAD